MNTGAKTYRELEEEVEELTRQLFEATETIEAIRTGQVDALIVHTDDKPQVYTLRTADEAYRVFIEQMKEGAVTTNRDGVIFYSNTSFANMLGLPLSDVLSSPFENFVAEAFRASYRETLHGCWDNVCKMELDLQAADKLIPVQLSTTALELESGLALSIIITDLTEQKHIQQTLTDNNRDLELAISSLEASNHDLQQFASIASHDLQEPLRKIQMFANHLQEGSLDDPGLRQQYLDKVISSAGRMRTLIVDILTYSRLSSNDGQFSDVDLNGLIKDLQEDQELRIAEKDAIIDTEKLPVVEGNTGQLRQVFQNLVSNSLKFSREGVQPVIRIRSKQIAARSFDAPQDPEGEFVLISVTDNGIGFHDAYAGKIFSLFERLHGKDVYEGTGIGLSIAKKIIAKHHGLITARGHEGRGAEFLIILPLKQTGS